MPTHFFFLTLFHSNKCQSGKSCIVAPRPKCFVTVLNGFRVTMSPGGPGRCWAARRYRRSAASASSRPAPRPSGSSEQSPWPSADPPSPSRFAGRRTERRQSVHPPSREDVSFFMISLVTYCSQLLAVSFPPFSIFEEKNEKLLYWQYRKKQQGSGLKKRGNEM